MQPVLETKNISKNYQGEPVITNINIKLNKGEQVALLGQSGSGKSTLFNVISGLLKPEEGMVLLDGQDVTGQTGIISYMQQKDLLLPHLCVIDNIALPLVLKGHSRKEARDQARPLLPKFGLEGTDAKYPAQLSGGMRQRVSFLRAHLFGSSIMLLDEPFSALDAITKRSLHQWYLTLSQEMEMTTLFITHEIDEAILLADRIYIMTGVPGHIENEIKISQERAKGLDFNVSADFLAYKKQILQLLHL